MPELPEVETVMRGLRARMDGRVLSEVAVHRAGMRWAFPDGLAAAMRGRRVTGFRRRAKYILMRLDSGSSVLIHLGMSGRMVIRPTREAAIRPLHEHMTIATDDGWSVGFVDPRRFGSVDLVPTPAEDGHRLLAGLGPEPLDPAFDATVLAAALAGRKTPVKAALLDQRTVAGLGNIYVCEALFRARLSPRRLARTIKPAAVARLVDGIKSVLGDAIAAGGSSLRDYVQPDGELGYFQHAWAVYGRAGQPCPVCPGQPACRGVVRYVQSARSTFQCARLQR